MSDLPPWYAVDAVVVSCNDDQQHDALFRLASIASTASAIADVARVFLLCCCLGGRAGGRDRPPLDRGKTESAFPGLCCLLFSIQRQRFGDANASLCHVFTEGCPR